MCLSQEPRRVEGKLFFLPHIWLVCFKAWLGGSSSILPAQTKQKEPDPSKRPSVPCSLVWTRLGLLQPSETHSSGSLTEPKSNLVCSRGDKESPAEQLYMRNADSISQGSRNLCILTKALGDSTILSSQVCSRFDQRHSGQKTDQRMKLMFLELLHLRWLNGADLQNHCYVLLSCGENLWIDIIGWLGFVPGIFFIFCSSVLSESTFKRKGYSKENHSK